MSEFEEELDYFIEREFSLDEKLSFGERDVLVDFFKDWHSGEDYQRAKRMVEHVQFENGLLKVKLKQQNIAIESLKKIYGVKYRIEHTIDFGIGFQVTNNALAFVIYESEKAIKEIEATE